MLEIMFFIYKAIILIGGALFILITWFAIAALIVSSKCSRAEEKFYEKQRLREQRRIIKEGCIKQSRGDYDEEL